MLLDVAGLRAADEAEPVLERAARRSGVIAAVDALAILILFVLRRADGPFLALGTAEETLFTAGVVAVAAHAGFRLGQREKYRAVARSLRELAERSPSH